MKTSINQYFDKFELLILTRSQSVIQSRRNYFTQMEMARKLGVSLKPIQNFESYKAISPYLCYGYEQILRNCPVSLT